MEGWGTITELVNIAAMLITAVWAVSKIKSTTDRLAFSLDHLRRTVDKLDVKFEVVTQELGGVRERLTAVETRQHALYCAQKPETEQ
jgi:hypothetical protein